MLPLLTKPRVRIYLNPEQLSVVLWQGFFRPQILDYQVFAVDTSPTQPSTQRHSAVLHRLVTALESLPKGSHIDIVLANHFCRFLILPWHENLDAHGQQQLRVALFNQHYAPEQAEDYQFSADNRHFGQAQLVTGMTQPFLTEIQQLITQTGHQLRSIQPSVVVVWNRFYRQLKHDTLLISEYHRHYLITQEKGYLQQLLIQPLALAPDTQSFAYFSADGLLSPTLSTLSSDMTHLSLAPYQLPSLLNHDEGRYQAMTLCGVF